MKKKIDLVLTHFNRKSYCQLLFFTIIISRLYKLQVIDSKKYKTLADENRIKLMIRMPERGKIYDDNGSIIASNKYIIALK